MSRSKRSTLEKAMPSASFAIAKKINRTKSKAEQPGYLKELVAKMYPEIESALARGCDYSGIAESMSVEHIKMTANTLKKYHQGNQKNRQIELSNIEPNNTENQKTMLFDSQRQDERVEGGETMEQSVSVDEKVPDVVKRAKILSGNNEDLSSQFNQF